MDYPSNSRNRDTKDDIPSSEPKKIEKVISGEVIRRKKSLGKRFTETFVGGDAKSVWGFVASEIFIPAAKDTIADAFSQGIERILFGESQSRSRRTGYRPGMNGYTNYQRYAKTTPLRPLRDEPRSLSRRGRASHNFDEIILPTRVEAEEVIDQMFELISKYESVTVAELYDLLGIAWEYTDQKWGWTDIRGAGPTRVRDGYLLDLPRPEVLD